MLHLRRSCDRLAVGSAADELTVAVDEIPPCGICPRAIKRGGANRQVTFDDDFPDPERSLDLLGVEAGV